MIPAPAFAERLIPRIEMKQEETMSSLIRWSAHPTRDLLGIRDEVDRLFDSVFSGSRAPAAVRNEWAFAPPIDVEETREAFVIRADLPGVSQKDIKVSLIGDTLTLRGERKSGHEENTKSLHRVERTHGTFERTLKLGVAVRNDQVTANYRDGVLEINVPKADEAKVREIEVSVS
jgi:HSP20 family protein